MTLYIDTWHVEARQADGFIYTCYGLPNEAKALEVAEPLRPISISVTVVHTTKETKRSHWCKKEFHLKPYHMQDDVGEAT